MTLAWTVPENVFNVQANTTKLDFTKSTPQGGVYMTVSIDMESDGVVSDQGYLNHVTVIHDALEADGWVFNNATQSGLAKRHIYET
mgnify:CR=1 FL=1